ncbi:MAG: DNA-binding protein [Candidatus Aegiribacteria sp.]|nr:DNA-binding protein [Candidatus Aegiribacteria sp.]
MKVIYRDNNRTVIRFDKGEQFPETLAQWCKEQEVNAAAIVAGIGMLENIVIGRYDGTEYIKETVKPSSEILSLQGNVSMKEGEPFVHLHVSLADEDMSSRGGHLFDGTVSMTIELVLMEIPDEFIRVPSGGAFWRLDTPSDKA